MKQRNDFLEWAKTKGPQDTLSHSSIAEPTIQEYVNQAYCSPRFQELLKEDNQWGLETLKSAIAERYGIKDTIDEPRVLLTPGASNAIYLVCRTFLSAGAEVILEAPYYEPLQLAIEATNAVIRYWPRNKDNFSVDLDSLTDLISSRTRLIIISNFHNPTGVSITRDELHQIANIAQKNHIQIVVDEIYLDIARDLPEYWHSTPTFGNGQISSAIQLGNELFISINSLSKVYGLSRLRTGWILASAEAIKKIRPIYKTVVNIGSLDTEAVSAVLLSNLDLYTVRSQKIIQNNRIIMQNELSDLIERNILSGMIPDYGCTYFPEIKFIENMSETDRAGIINTLDRECGVVPGGFFGKDYSNHIRIGLGGPTDAFSISVKRLKKKLIDLCQAK